MTNADLNEEMEAIIEAAELDENQQAKLEREFKQNYQLITRDERLDKIAADLVDHFMGRGVLAKAMVVSIDKATAVRTYDKVQKHWKAALGKLRREVAAADPMDRPELEQRLEYFEKTDMAVVVPSRRAKSRSSRRKGSTSPRVVSGR